MKARNEAERQRNREYAKRYRINNPEKAAISHRKANAKWKKKHREKHVANNIVWRYIGYGKLVRPSSCQRCGRISAIHAHHHDYSKPLDVEWLCIYCHELIHHGPPEKNTAP